MKTMEKPLHVLMLEDDPEDAELIEIFLRSSFPNISITLVVTKEAFVKTLDEKQTDVILSDYNLPQFSALDALKIRNEKKLHIPFILVSGAIPEQFAVTLLRAGASDYILKDRPQRLVTAISEALNKSKSIVEKLQTERELIESNERFNYVSRATSDAVWDFDLINRHLVWGEGYRTLFGYKLENTKADFSSLIDHIHPDDRPRVVEGFKSVLESELENNWADEYRYEKADGTYAFVIGKGIVVRDQQNKPYRVVGVMQDITAIVKNNHDLRQFTYIASHNLKAPLSNLLAIINLIDHSNLSASNAELIDMMKTSTVHLKETIQHLTEILIIKNKEVHFECVDLAEVLTTVKDNLHDEILKVNPRIELDLETGTVNSHKSYLENIFQNLLHNSLKYQAPGRELLVKLRCEKAHNRTIITYSDNGTGIDLARHKEKMFGMYQRFHENIEGKGLGLFLVKSQVVAMGGEIKIESEPGNGTNFQIIL